jgi:hypothetical protein
MDNNDELLSACLSGKTADQLHKSGIDYKESQIALLKIMRLLREKDNTLKTAIPVFGPEKTKSLRNTAEQAAKTLYPAIKKDVIGLVRHLKTRGRESNTYSILFSFILDGLVWDELEKREMISSLKITAEKPFWDGEVWSVYPKRAFSCGTNTSTIPGLSLSLNWSPAAPDLIWSFWGNRETRMQMLRDAADNGRIDDENIIKTFAGYNLFDEHGNITIPVIDTQPDNRLFSMCRNIAETTAANISSELALSEIKKWFGLRDNKQTMIIVYHEVIWELLQKFEQDNIIERPTAFANPLSAEKSDVSDLLFFVTYN